MPTNNGSDVIARHRNFAAAARQFGEGLRSKGTCSWTRDDFDRALRYIAEAAALIQSLTSQIEKGREAFERVQDEASTVGPDWRETASMIDRIMTELDDSTVCKIVRFLAEYEALEREKASSWTQMGGPASAHIRTPVAEAANNRANAIAALLAELQTKPVRAAA